MPLFHALALKFGHSILAWRSAFSSLISHTFARSCTTSCGTNNRHHQMILTLTYCSCTCTHIGRSCNNQKQSRCSHSILSFQQTQQRLSIAADSQSRTLPPAFTHYMHKTPRTLRENVSGTAAARHHSFIKPESMYLYMALSVSKITVMHATAVPNTVVLHAHGSACQCARYSRHSLVVLFPSNSGRNRCNCYTTTRAQRVDTAKTLYLGSSQEARSPRKSEF